MKLHADVYLKYYFCVLIFCIRYEFTANSKPNDHANCGTEGRMYV